MNFDIMVSNRCNLNCIHCCMKKRLNCKGFKLDFDFIRYQLNKYNEKGTIHLSGGEPLLINENDMRELINLIDENKDKYRFFMTSNLCLDLTDLRKELISKVDMSTSFDNNLGRFKSFKNINKWYHNCKYIVKNQPLNVFITYHKNLHKYDNIVKLIDMIDEIGFKNAYLNPFMNFNNNYEFYNYDELLGEITILDSVAKQLMYYSSNVFSESRKRIEHGYGLECNYPYKDFCICIEGSEIVNCILDPQCNYRKEKENSNILDCKYLEDKRR